ncbi:MAG: transcriptional regulator [Rikenellaceae bacterium]
MFKELDPLLHSELRLSIISLLISVESADFSYIKEKTGASSGNISVQIEKLRVAGYIKVEKGYRGKIPQTMCSISQEGIVAFEKYVDALKSYIMP